MFLVPFALVWLLFSAFFTSFSTWALGWPSPLPSLGLGAWWGTFVFFTGFAGLMFLFGFVLMGVMMLTETSSHRSPYA